MTRVSPVSWIDVNILAMAPKKIIKTVMTESWPVLLLEKLVYAWIIWNRDQFMMDQWSTGWSMLEPETRLCLTQVQWYAYTWISWKGDWPMLGSTETEIGLNDKLNPRLAYAWLNWNRDTSIFGLTETEIGLCLDELKRRQVYASLLALTGTDQNKEKVQQCLFQWTHKTTSTFSGQSPVSNTKQFGCQVLARVQALLLC